MTRRIRFTPWTAAGLLAVTAALSRPPAAHATDVPFVEQAPISTTALSPIGVVTADLDGDGDTDALPVLLNDDKVTWRENVAGDGSAWIARTIATGTGGAFAVFPADVDGDGDLDVVSALLSYNAVIWSENVSGNGSVWTTHTITRSVTTYSISAADVDGDGDIDVVATLGGPAMLGWLENDAGNGSTWTFHTIVTGPGFGRLATVSDVDSDGDADVVATLVSPDALVWYDNTVGDGSTWTGRTISTAAQGAYSIFTVDVDTDGDTDVLAPSPGDAVSWYENNGAGTAWTIRPIATNTPGSAAVFAADLDRDGDHDVLVASHEAAAIRWHENISNGSAWTVRTLTTALLGALSVVAADVDGDGDPDVLSAAEDARTVAWYRNETIHATACFVTRPPINTSVFEAWSVDTADMEGDGDPDVLTASSFDNKVSWFQNVGGSGSNWLANTISAGVTQARSVDGADLDGDGDADVVTVAFGTSRLIWFANAGNGLSFVPHLIAELTLPPRSVLAVDMDGDSDRDVLSLSFEDDRVYWYENINGNGQLWVARNITTGAAGAWAAFAADVDGDGDMDALSGSITDSTAAWYENVDGNGIFWTTRTITTAAPGIRTIRTADVDGDGDVDALATTDGDSTVAWYENADGSGLTWVTHAIATGVFLPYAAIAADMDGDGDADVLSSTLVDGSVTLYENADGQGSSWTPRTITTQGGLGIRSLAHADVDSDGDRDALSVSQFAGRVDWHENRGGQFSLVASDTAPPTADNGDIVSMLRIDATHLGRPGDHDLELGSLGLLFEASPGTALTTPEANALIESLRVYRDADGNGVFGPGDILVASLPALSLTSGIQTVAFADADPNVQVAQGSPRTYFVVVELTADASQQSPHQFGVTHLGLGPSASRAEDRAFDIGLRPSCPADVTSTFKQVVPVELMRFTVE
jgi:hypothetical protein